MGFYANHIEPRLVSCACGMPAIRRERAKIVPEASGRVLEIGFGSGHNIPFYDDSKISHLYALEPSETMRKLSEPRLSDVPFPVEWVDLPGEQIPLDEASVDCVLVTFTLCTIADVDAALVGVRRVLKPGGKLVFLEHGRSPDEGIAKWQDRINGVWGKLAGGCHLNRIPDLLIEKQGFEMVNLERRYVPKTPKIAGFLTSGVALR